MPEGDTLHSIARRVGPVLTGRTVTHMRTSDLGPIKDAVGWTVNEVRAVGKHLLISFSGDWTLRTHLGMHGRVWLARHDRPAPSTAVFAITVGMSASRTVVCTRAYRTEFVRTAWLSTHARLSRLGPDLLGDTFDLEQVLARATDPGHSHREIADVLLDQRIAAGIGNVYKSELLFLRGIHPMRTAGTVTMDQFTSLYNEARRLLQFNLKTRRRTTVPTQRRPSPASPRLWVYGRAGDPCLNCGTPIERFMQGEMLRSTYHCPRCQSDTTLVGAPDV